MTKDKKPTFAAYSGGISYSGDAENAPPEIRNWIVETLDDVLGSADQIAEISGERPEIIKARLIATLNSALGVDAQNRREKE
jgi:hypothetical protein